MKNNPTSNQFLFMTDDEGNLTLISKEHWLNQNLDLRQLFKRGSN